MRLIQLKRSVEKKPAESIVHQMMANTKDLYNCILFEMSLTVKIMNKPDYRESQSNHYMAFDELAYVYEPLDCEAIFKQRPEDFIVDEVLPFELSGSGEHAWLHIRKQGENTEWVAKELARVSGVRKRDVGFAGLKDRHGITTQWFSVWLPGQTDPDWSALETQNIQILKTVRHAKKLRRGALKENLFTIVLRELSGEQSQLVSRCEVIMKEGVPNYFGEQRFGHGMDNLMSAEKMFVTDERVPRHLKSIYLSAARSWIFNCILSQRITDGNWNQYLSGDAFMLNGKSACFMDDASADINQRLSDGEIHPTGVLWGVGEQLAAKLTEGLELDIVNRFEIFKTGLESFKVQRLRRALRVFPGSMQWQFEGETCTLKFSLPSGSYATMVLRELLMVNEAIHQTSLSR